jgi:hypothetical protein
MILSISLHIDFEELNRGEEESIESAAFDHNLQTNEHKIMSMFESK